MCACCGIQKGYFVAKKSVVDMGIKILWFKKNIICYQIKQVLHFIKI